MLKTNYDNLEFVVADNRSTDDSISLLENEFPSVRLIRLDKNYGFADGYNRALKEVTSDYYMILNSDVQVDPDWIQPLVDLLESNDRIAACQPKILSLTQPGLFDYAGAAGGWLDSYGYPFARGRVFDHCEQDNGQYNYPAPIFWASGAALFIRAAVFHQVGGFDPYFFAHQEEIDLCWRIQRMGYLIYACPQSAVHHLGGGTLPRGNSLKTYLNFRNNHIMLFKNLKLGRKALIIPIRFALDAVSAWKGLLGGDAGYFLAILRAHFAFYKWLLLHGWNHWRGGGSVNGLKGLCRKNIAWAHFAQGRKTFTEICPNGNK